MKPLDTLSPREFGRSSPPETANLWNRTSRLSEITQVLKQIATWPGVAIQSDDDGLRIIAGREALGHLRWDGRLDLPFPADVQRRLIADAMAASGHDQPGHERLAWMVRTSADVDHAVSLLRLSYLLCCGDFDTHVQIGENHGHLK